MPGLEQATVRRSRRRWAIAAIALVAALVGAALVASDRIAELRELYADQGLAGVYYRLKDQVPGAPANVRWDTAEPEQQGFSAPALDALWRQIDRAASQRIPGGAWRAADLRALRSSGRGPQPASRHLGAGKVGHGGAGPPDRPERRAPVARRPGFPLRPAVARGPGEAAITVRQLLAHSSGLDDVNFLRKQSAWKQVYLEQADQRFRQAVTTTPVLYEPGTRYSYSGVGYYVLAYAAAVAFSEDGEHADLKSLLARRIMQPLGIPQHDWIISYRTPTSGMDIGSTRWAAAAPTPRERSRRSASCCWIAANGRTGGSSTRARSTPCCPTWDLRSRESPAWPTRRPASGSGSTPTDSGHRCPAMPR